MYTDIVLRTAGMLACMYTIALFVSVMSTATLNAASSAAPLPCVDSSCRMARQEATVPAEADIVHSVIMFAGNL